MRIISKSYFNLVMIMMNGMMLMLVPMLMILQMRQFPRCVACRAAHTSLPSNVCSGNCCSFYDDDEQNDAGADADADADADAHDSANETISQARCMQNSSYISSRPHLMSVRGIAAVSAVSSSAGRNCRLYIRKAFHFFKRKNIFQRLSQFVLED